MPERRERHVLIRRLHDDVQIPKYHSEGAVGFDLAADRDMQIAPNGIALISTGLVIQTPPGHMLMLVARSSTPIKLQLQMPNGVGIIDQDYCGPEDELKIPVYNFSRSSVCTVRRGDRIAQGVLLPITIARFQEVDEIAPESRGGFGSTDPVAHGV